MTDKVLTIIGLLIAIAILTVGIISVHYTGQHLISAGSIPGWYRDHAVKDAALIIFLVLTWGGLSAWSFIETWRSR